MTEEKEKLENSVSRRSFLFTLASVASYSLMEFAPQAANAEALQQFDPFSFAYISDVHLAINRPDGVKLFAESQLFLQDVVKTLNGLPDLDFTMFGGDQVEGPGKDEKTWQLFLDVVQNLQKPWFFVLGESDVSGPVTVNRQLSYGPDFKGKGVTTGKSFWSLEVVPHVRAIGLDTGKPNSTTGELSDEQLKFLKDELAAHSKQFTMIFSHHPLLPPAPFDSGPPWDDYICPQGEAAREMLGDSASVRLAVSGHLGISKIDRERNVWYVSSPGLAMYPCAFRIFRVTQQNITVETYEVGFPALVKKGRQMMLGSNLAFKYNGKKPEAFLSVAEGSRADQDSILTFGKNGTMTAAEKKRIERPRVEKETKAEKPGEKPAEAEEKGGLFKRKPKKEKTKPEKSDKSDKSDKTKDASNAASGDDSGGGTKNESVNKLNDKLNDLQEQLQDMKNSRSNETPPVAPEKGGSDSSSFPAPTPAPTK